MTYAKNTTVPIGRSVEEINRVVVKAGADGFGFAEAAMGAQVMFRLHGRGIKMSLRYPNPPSPTANEASKKTYEQLKKARWRCLLLCIKAKIESIEAKIETVEEAFLPHLVMVGGETIGQRVIPYIDQLENVSPSMLLGME